MFWFSLKYPFLLFCKNCYNILPNLYVDNTKLLLKSDVVLIVGGSGVVGCLKPIIFITLPSRSYVDLSWIELKVNIKRDKLFYIVEVIRRVFVYIDNKISHSLHGSSSCT